MIHEFGYINPLWELAFSSDKDFYNAFSDPIEGFDQVHSDEAHFPEHLLPEVLKHKAEHGTVYYSRIRNVHFIFRLAKRFEFDTYKAYFSVHGASNTAKEKVFKNCILYSSGNENTLRAFTISSFVNMIYQMSDFDDLEYHDDLQDSFRQSLEKRIITSIVPWSIKRFSPSLTMNQIEHMDISEQSMYLGALSHFSDGEFRISLSSKRSKLV